jgi:hypothetical protein
MVERNYTLERMKQNTAGVNLIFEVFGSKEASPIGRGIAQIRKDVRSVSRVLFRIFCP